VAKIRENLLKLQDLKVGQLATGKAITSPTVVALKDAKGAALASVALGDTHMAKPKGQMAQFGGGGYPDGRYVLFDGKTPVLVKDALEAFDGDPKKWIDTRICAVFASPIPTRATSETANAGRIFLPTTEGVFIFLPAVVQYATPPSTTATAERITRFLLVMCLPSGMN